MGEEFSGSGFATTSTSRRTVLVGLLGAAVAGCGTGGESGGTGSPTGTGSPAGGTGSPTGSGTAAAPGDAPTVVELPVMVNGKKANFHGEQSVIGKQSVSVELDDFYFGPTVLVGSSGQQLTLNLVNEGDLPHTFTIESQDIDVVLQPGQQGQTQVRFPESGRQGFVCRFHIAQGMLGLLVVQP